MRRSEPHRCSSSMSLLDHAGIAVYDWATALTAVVFAVSHGMSWHVGGPLVLFGLIVDLNRFPANRRPVDPALKTSRFGFPIRLYFRPVWMAYLVGATVATLVLLYYSYPEACWPVFNEWIETNIAVAKLRMEYFPVVCDMPHGTILLLSQGVLPIIVVIGIAMSVTAARFNPDRFVQETAKYLRSRRDKQVKWWHPAVPIFFILFLAFMVTIPPFMRIEDATPRSLVPQHSVVSFLLWQVLYLFSIALAHGTAEMTTRLYTVESE